MIAIGPAIRAPERQIVIMARTNAVIKREMSATGPGADIFMIMERL